jgi:hypothetical protein
MKSTSAFFAVWSVTAVLSPVFASCPQEQESGNRGSVVQQDAQPCRANQRMVLAQNEDTPTASAPPKQVNTYQEQRLVQPNGLGFGLAVAGLPGVQIFYDRTLDVSSQLHAQISHKLGTSTNIFDTASIDVTQLSALVTYRRFISPNLGFYYGGGLGFAQNELEFSDTGFFFSQPANYKAKGQGLFALAEIGWQGDKGYYFHVGFQPAFYLSYDDDYDVLNIPDTGNYRHVANDDWDQSKRISQLELGFGWFF